ncbi:hypothetical protein ACL02U_15945 [Streptomyces sp. MS06]|uniref:hypothetical protein n=1 Tax=Streptomyces sp. MS06 TaxID=3385974 RepID=UPI0039A0E028
MTADDHLSGPRELLLGATVRSVGRAADMGVIECADRDGGVIGVHVQCPFRILQGGHLLLGSRDMRFARRGAGTAAFERFETVYDARALTLNGILERLRPPVTDVVLGDAGSLVVRCRADLRVEAFPDCSGSVEAWRVFLRGGPHTGFPDDVVRGETTPPRDPLRPGAEADTGPEGTP